MNVLRSRGVVVIMMLIGFGALPDAMAQERDAAAQDRRETRYQSRARFRTLEFAKSLVIDRAPREFVDISFSDLPTKQKGRMYTRLAAILQWFAHPQDKGQRNKLENTVVRVFAAYQEKEVDLVEYRWVHRGQELRALVRKSVVRLDIQLDEAKENPRLDEYGTLEIERVRGFVSSVLRLKGETNTRERHPYELIIPWPTDLADDVSFCSNPEVDLLSMDVYYWFSRIDAFVHDRTLSFLFYMKPGQLVGYPGGSRWFSDEFRAEVHKKAREQGRVPEEPGPMSEE